MKYLFSCITMGGAIYLREASVEDSFLLVVIALITFGFVVRGEK